MVSSFQKTIHTLSISNGRYLFKVQVCIEISKFNVFCENCDVAERKEYIDESMRRYFGVADHAIDTEEAKRLWEETEKMISSF